jgi:RNA polymerase sigma factor (sigma-70 family)
VSYMHPNYVFCSPLLDVQPMEDIVVVDEDGIEQPFEIDDPAPDAETLYIRASVVDAVGQFLASLTEREREVLHRIFWCEETQASVARALGLTAAAINKIIKRVLERARRVLAGCRWTLAYL